MALENSTIHSAQQSKLRYSFALRCIGQNIESIDLKAVELKTQGDSYLVQGWGKGLMASMNLDKLYTIEDIKRLDLGGRKKRSAESELPNLLSLSQVLRLAGNYVDRMRGRLLRVSWQDQSDKIQSVTIQYEAFGNERSESQIAVIEELCIHVYKQRKRMAAGCEKIGQRPLVGIGVGT